MFPHPECTKQTRTLQQNNNNQNNSIQNNSIQNNSIQNNSIQNNNKDFLRPVISNPSIPLYYNHDSYMNDKGKKNYNFDVERSITSSRNDKDYRPVQSQMQSNYQFFNNNNNNNNIINEFRNPVNTRRDNLEKSRQSDTQQFRSVQGGPISNFQDIRYVNTRTNKNNDINTSSYTPMARTLAIPKEQI
jgi:hypothetical protein